MVKVAEISQIWNAYLNLEIVNQTNVQNTVGHHITVYNTLLCTVIYCGAIILLYTTRYCVQ
jgi:hypothetical protein